MKHPPTPEGPGHRPTYSLTATLLASLLIVGGLFVVVLLVEYPVVGALLAAGAMVTHRLVEEVRDAKRRFPSDGEQLCYCIPYTDTCIHI